MWDIGDNRHEYHLVSSTVFGLLCATSGVKQGRDHIVYIDLTTYNLISLVSFASKAIKKILSVHFAIFLAPS